MKKWIIEVYNPEIRNWVEVARFSDKIEAKITAYRWATRFLRTFTVGARHV